MRIVQAEVPEVHANDIPVGAVFYGQVATFDDRPLGLYLRVGGGVIDLRQPAIGLMGPNLNFLHYQRVVAHVVIEGPAR